MSKITQKQPKSKEKGSEPSLFDIQESIIPEDKRIFYPNWNNQPPEAKPVILAQKKKVLTTGNLMVISSQPGTGKSSICEAILASIINQDCDSLGFIAKLQGGRHKALYIDTERTRNDHWRSWVRMNKRAGINAPDVDNRIIFANLKAVKLDDRKKFVEQILKDNNDIGLIILDGAGDFLIDTNNLAESNHFIDWINTFNPSISIVVTIHTNPGTDKVRGHLGSELMRRAESVFLLKKTKDEEGGITREITTNYEHGKVRNDGDNISIFYTYDEEIEMFVSDLEYIPTPSNPKKDNKIKNLVKKAKKIFDFSNQEFMTYSQIVENYMNMTKMDKEDKKEINAAQTWVKRNFIGTKILENVGDRGLYKLNKNIVDEWTLSVN